MTSFTNLRTLSLLGGLGLLTACPIIGETSTGTTDLITTDELMTNTSATTDSTTSSTTEPTTSGSTTASTTDPSTTGPTTTDPTTGPPPTSLCDRLGGEDGIGDLVTDALGVVLADDRVNGYFLNSDVDAANLGTCLVKQLGQLATCPGVTYDCADMKTAHAGLGISANDFMDFAVDLSTALDSHQAAHPDLTDADKMDILSALGGMAPDIVEDPGSDLTVYQRVGRKPAIKALVGKPGEAGSFVDNVAADVAINGFFGATDFDRLNTCLYRQVAGIDGPVAYGLEVDSPADPGVGLADPCRDMASAHAGLVDAGDMIGIDINDFGALVADLVAAMSTAGVAQADQDAILGALGPLCGDILAPEFKNQCPDASKMETVELLMIGQPIPDNGYDGTPAPPKMACIDLVVPDDGINFVQTVVEVGVGIIHPAANELTIKLVGPAGDRVLTLLNRPTFAEAADNGLGAGGNPADLSAMFPLTFKNGAPNDAEQLGAGLGNTQVVCKDDMIDPCEWAPSPGKGPGVDLGDFLGDAADGTWRLCVGDSIGTGIGQIASARLVLAKVKYDPTP